MRAEANRKDGKALIAAAVMPAGGQVTGGEAARIVPGLLECLLVQGGRRGVIEGEDVIGLDVKSPDREIRGAAQHLQRRGAPLLDEHLVVGEALEVTKPDLCSLCREKRVRLGLPGIAEVAVGIIEV